MASRQPQVVNTRDRLIFDRIFPRHRLAFPHFNPEDTAHAQPRRSNGTRTPIAAMPPSSLAWTGQRPAAAVLKCAAAHDVMTGLGHATPGLEVRRVPAHRMILATPAVDVVTAIKDGTAPAPAANDVGNALLAGTLGVTALTVGAGVAIVVDLGAKTVVHPSTCAGTRFVLVAARHALVLNTGLVATGIRAAGHADIATCCPATGGVGRACGRRARCARSA